MFLKESLAIFTFGASTLGISGFAIKIDKFEYNYLIFNQVNLTVESYKKLSLRKGDNFYYTEEDKPKLLKIADIKVISPKTSKESEYIQLTLEPKRFSKFSYQRENPNYEGKIIKYKLESKPFWMNLFG